MGPLGKAGGPNIKGVLTMAYYVKDITYNHKTRFISYRKARIEVLKNIGKLYHNKDNGLKAITLLATKNEYEAYARERGTH